MASTLLISALVLLPSLLGCLSSSVPVSPGSFTTCPRDSTQFFNDLQSRCPLSYSAASPLEVDNDFLDRKINFNNWGKGYTSILFYGSSCPFSHNVHMMFKVLSSMFPQIEHLAIEQASAMPRTFSLHGIHSLPAIIMVNRSSRMRFQGSKDLPTLVKFYKEATGLEPIDSVDIEQHISLESSKKFVLQSWVDLSVDEILSREPYLVISLLFLCARAFVFLLPKILCYFHVIWMFYGPHLNPEIFVETSHMLGHVIHMINLKTVWTKLKLFKTRHFHQGAKNARVWASLTLSRS